jgi:hypothetical protein
MKDFRELKVWVKAHALTLACYQLTKDFPRYELFGLASQIRRCASSVPANIAEGCGRIGNAELHRSCKSHVVPPTNSNITFSSPKTSNILRSAITNQFNSTS